MSSSPCVCVGGGGGCSFNATAEQTVRAFGYAYNPNDGIPYASVLAQDAPRGLSGNYLVGWKALAEACMRARACLFCTRVPGDAGIAPAGSYSSIAIAQQATNAAVQGATLGETIATVGATSALGLATLGAGVVAGIIFQIFTSHAAAEARQQQALNKLCPEATAAIQAIDREVLAGSITPEVGISTLKQIAQWFNANTAALEKSCNAFCGYDAILNCIADISQYYYGTFPAPASITSAPLASNPQATAVPILQTAPQSQPSEIVVLSPPAPSGGSNFLSSLPSWVLIAIALLLVLLVSGPGEEREREPEKVAA